jgi:hypothetical protein
MFFSLFPSPESGPLAIQLQPEPLEHPQHERLKARERANIVPQPIADEGVTLNAAGELVELPVTYGI